MLSNSPALGNSPICPHDMGPISLAIRNPFPGRNPGKKTSPQSSWNWIITIHFDLGVDSENWTSRKRVFFVLPKCVFFVVLGLWDQSGFGPHLLSFLSKTETEGNEKLPLHISSWKNDFYKNTLPADPKHLEPQILILSVCFTFFHLLRVKRGRIQNAGTGFKNILCNSSG